MADDEYIGTQCMVTSFEDTITVALVETITKLDQFCLRTRGLPIDAKFARVLETHGWGVLRY